MRNLFLFVGLRYSFVLGEMSFTLGSKNRSKTPCFDHLKRKFLGMKTLGFSMGFYRPSWLPRLVDCHQEPPLGAEAARWAASETLRKAGVIAAAKMEEVGETFRLEGVPVFLRVLINQFWKVLKMFVCFLGSVLNIFRSWIDRKDPTPSAFQDDRLAELVRRQAAVVTPALSG